MDVPPILAALPNWVLWSADKIPLQPSGQPAKSNDPTTWSTLADVLAVEDQFENRIGFMFRESDGLVGIDLDGAVSEGVVAPWALAIVNDFNCYSEFSPSGKGIHVICQGSLPDARGRKIKLNEPATSDKQPAIEIYSNGRYFTFTGDAIGGEVSPAQDALDRLLQQYWPTAPRTNPTPRPAILSDRITQYMRTIEPAVSGQGGHSRTMWAARCLVTGFCLSAEEASVYLAEWNAGCVPPWSEKELAHKISQAIATRCDKPAGWLLAERETWPAVNTDHIQLGNPASDKILSEATQPLTEPNNLPRDPLALSPEFFAVPGIIADMVRFHLETSPRPRPELSLAATIALIGTVTGRKIRTASGMRSNIYVIGLAPSGSGKERPRNNNIMALTETACPEYLGSENPASDSALVNEIADQPSRLIQIDEISRFFNNIKDSGNNSAHLKTIFTRFLELTGNSENPCWCPKGFADGKKTRRVAHPHLCIYGTSTSEGFWKSVKSSDAVDGFLARMMVIEAPDVYPRLRDVETRPIPTDVIERLKAWHTFRPGGGNLDVTAALVPIDSAAVDRIRKHSDDIEDRLGDDSKEQKAIWSRTSALAKKLAMIFAASRGPDGLQVSLADAEYAVRLANWCTWLLVRRIWTHVTENEHDSKKKRVLQIVREAGEINWRDVTRKTSWLRDQRERDEILKDLIEAEFIGLVPHEGRAKPSLRYLAG